MPPKGSRKPPTGSQNPQLSSAALPPPSNGERQPEVRNQQVEKGRRVPLPRVEPPTGPSPPKRAGATELNPEHTFSAARTTASSRPNPSHRSRARGKHDLRDIIDDRKSRTSNRESPLNEPVTRREFTRLREDIQLLIREAGGGDRRRSPPRRGRSPYRRHRGSVEKSHEVSPRPERSRHSPPPHDGNSERLQSERKTRNNSVKGESSIRQETEASRQSHPRDGATERRLKELEDRLARIAGSSDPRNQSRQPPFTQNILDAEMPQKFRLPNIDAYDGETDPADHLNAYTMHLLIQGVSDAVMCRAFPATLKGPARDWYASLPPGSIPSFAKLEEAFLSHFITSKRPRKNSASLLGLRQRHDESLRDYLVRFNKEVRNIADPETSVPMAAFCHNVNHELLKMSLAKKPPRTYLDLLHRVEKYINAEEAVQVKRQAKSSENWENKRKAELEEVPRKAQRIDQSGRISAPNGQPKQFTPLTISHSALLQEVRGDRIIAPPPKMRTPAEKRDRTRWCEHHQDYGHTADECHILKKQVESLIHRGHLKEYIRKKDDE